jgi:phospholipid/cholesterol/gamma-HCH transport system substrate-binding protein
MRRTRKPRLSFFQIGIIAIVLAIAATYFGFTKSVPFRHHYTVSAMFKTANNVKPNSLVRIAGVNVGKVTEVKLLHPGDPAAEVKMRLEKKGLPIHEDATFKIRPRIFLEGNFFVDIHPGTPNAPLIKDGHTFPVNQTSAPVQLDQVLTVLQSSTRKDLQKLLRELSTGLSNGGAAGYQRSVPYWVPAYKHGAEVSDATLGILQHDLSGYIAHSQKVARALDRFPTQLQNPIVDLNTTAHALGVHDQRLQAAIAELPRTLAAGLPALRELNHSFPAVRRFVRTFDPAVKSSGPAIDAQLPFVDQLQRLVQKPELRGLVGELRPTVPNLAKLNNTSVPLYDQVRAASSCQNNFFLPLSHEKLDDPVFPADGPIYQEAPKPIVGLAGESRSGDANGQWFRVLLGGGNYVYPQVGGQYIITGDPIVGVNPAKPAKRPPLRPDVPCETQQRPDLASKPGPPPSGRRVSTGGPGYAARYAKAQKVAVDWLKKSINREGLAATLKVVDKPVTSAAELAKLPGLGQVGKVGKFYDAAKAKREIARLRKIDAYRAAKARKRARHH